MRSSDGDLRADYEARSQIGPTRRSVLRDVLTTLFCAGLLAAAEPGLTAQRQVGPQRLERLLKRFPDADADRDGELTFDEARAYLRKRGSGRSGHTTPSRPAEAALNAASPASAAAAGPVEIRISSSKPVSINPRVYGIICEQMFVKDLVDEPEYIAALTDLKFKTFVYPGGSASYYHHPRGTGGFNIRPEEVRKSKHGDQSRFMKEGAGPDHFEQYMKFVKASGGEAVFTANILNGTVAELEEFLSRLQAGRIPIACVVLGVEMHLGQATALGLDGYLDRIKPYIAMLQAKYPHVPIVAHSTPVGRVGKRARASFHEWNQALASLPGIDGFSQYGWPEFGSEVRRLMPGVADQTPAERWRHYDEFTRTFPDRQLPAYQRDWGSDKKMYMLQWGTHLDRNTPVQGLHMANFYFFLARYNAAHDDYFAVATSAPILAASASEGLRRGGVIYQDKIALFASYYYTKPFRHLFSGDKKLLAASVQASKNDTTAGSVKAIAAGGPDGRKYVYVLNSGPAAPLGEVALNGEPLSADLPVGVESVWAAPASAGVALSGATPPVRVFVGERRLNRLVLEPFSLTLLIIPNEAQEKAADEITTIAKPSTDMTAEGLMLGTLTSGQTTLAQQEVAGGQVPALENNVLRVSLSPQDASLTVVDKRIGLVWRQQARPGFRVAPDSVSITATSLSAKVVGEDGIYAVTLSLAKKSPHAFDLQLEMPDQRYTVLPAYPFPFVAPGKSWYYVQNTTGEGMLMPLEKIEEIHKPFGWSGGQPWWGLTDLTRAMSARLETFRCADRSPKREDQTVYAFPLRINYAFFTEGGYVRLAKEYRSYFLDVHPELQPLHERVQARPAVSYLKDGVYVYLWGRNPDEDLDLVAEMKAAGIERGIAAFYGRHEIDRTLCDGIKQLGWTVGRYQMPTGNLFRVSKNRGWPSALLRGRLSPQKLLANSNFSAWDRVCGKQVLPAWMERAKASIRDYGVELFYFDTLVVQLAPCLHPDHPSTIEENQQARREIMQNTRALGMVVGSGEGICPTWALSDLDFFEGQMSLRTYVDTPLKIPSGGYETDLGSDYRAQAAFTLDETRRIPLYQLGFHDYVTGTWAWRDTNYQSTPFAWKKDLFNILYGTMPMWHITRRLWESRKAKLVASYRDIASVRKRIGFAEMVGHGWLSADRSVQFTDWETGDRVIVNFGDRPFDRKPRDPVPPRSFVVERAEVSGHELEGRVALLGAGGSTVQIRSHQGRPATGSAIADRHQNSKREP